MGIVLTGRLIIAETLKDGFTVIEKRGFIAIPAVILMINVLAPFEIGELIVYTSFFIGISYLAIRVYNNIKKQTDKFDDKNIKRYKRYMYIVIALSIIGIIEAGLYFMSYSTKPNMSGSLSDMEFRVIAFDLMKVVVCFIGIRSANTC